jgi:hypothetical protein
MHSLMQPCGCTGRGGGVDNSTAFVQAEPSIVKFLVFLGSLRTQYLLRVINKTYICSILLLSHNWECCTILIHK